MIRMIQIQSAEQAKDYHNDALAQADYYINDQELKGSFHGRIAKRLGIEGEARKQDFDALCENLNPSTLKNLTPRTIGNRTVGYDISFHVPKSVSVLHVLSKGDHVLKVFRQSVHDTMLDIEADSKARVRKRGKDEDRVTGELIWAEFIHQTARPTKDAEPDPHLHCHCFTFNATWDKVENTFKAGQFRDIKRDMNYYQARFHKRLADHLTALGYRIRRTRTSFEVVGVPENVLSLFSKRTNEINKMAQQQGITDAKQLDQLGARTRAKKKRGLSMAALKKEWRRQIHELGLTGDGKAGDPIRHPPGRMPDGMDAAACVNHALLHSFERASVVHDKRILENAYRHSIGFGGATVDQITNCFRRDKRIIKVKDGARLLCTTHQVLAEEKRMVALAVAGKGALEPLYRTPPALSLEGKQADAVRHVLTTADHVSIIRGRAGTGKTTLMKEAVRLIEAKGKKVVIVAPTSQAARGVLKEEGFADAETVAKLLSDTSLQERLTDAVLWVDEAGLLGIKDTAAIMELASEHKARVILSGDTRQHSSVARGDALRVLNTVAGVIPAEVSKIYRQRNEAYRMAVEELSSGNVKDAFTRLDNMGAIKSVNPAGYDALVNDYAAALAKGKTVLAVSPTHAEGQSVTAALRAALRKAGKIGALESRITRLVNLNLTEAEKSDYRSYQAGYVIQFNQNRKGVVRGSTWHVLDISRNGLTIARDGKKPVLINLEKTNDFEVYIKTEIGISKGDAIFITRNMHDENKKRLNNGQTLEIVDVTDEKIIACNPKSKTEYILSKECGHVNHAYCLTSHASQGKTASEILIWQPAPTFRATDMKQFYVSVSRGRDAVHIYTDDKDGLLNHATGTGDRQSATELISTIRKPFARSLIKRRGQEYISAPKSPGQLSKQQRARSHEPKPCI